MSTHSTLSMEKLRSELSFQKEIGSGQPFGYFLNIMLTDNGQHLVKLIWLNHEEMIATDKLEVLILLELHFTLDQTISMMLMNRQLSNTSIPNHLEMISIFTVLNGQKMASSQQLMEKKSLTSNLTKTCGLRVNSQRACTIHGNMKPKRALLSTNHTTSSLTLQLVELMATSQMDNAANNGQTQIHTLQTLSGTLSQLGVKPGNLETPLFKLTMLK